MTLEKIFNSLDDFFAAQRATDKLPVLLARLLLLGGGRVQGQKGQGAEGEGEGGE